MLRGDETSLPRHADDTLEEQPRDVGLEQTVTIFREAGGIEALLVEIHAEEEPEQEVVVEALAELSLAANRVEGHQQRTLEEPLRWNGRSTHRRVHRVEHRRQLGELLVGQALDHPDRMPSRDPTLWRHGRERHLRSRLASHDLP